MDDRPGADLTPADLYEMIIELSLRLSHLANLVAQLATS